MTDTLITAGFYSLLALGTVMSVIFLGFIIADDCRKGNRK